MCSEFCYLAIVQKRKYGELQLKVHALTRIIPILDPEVHIEKLNMIYIHP